MDRQPRFQVVILAGGLGTRLKPITEKIPKPIVPVAGKPYLEWQLLDLKKQGYTKILLLVSYLGEMIEKEFGDGSKMGLQISYSYESEPMGTGGALKLAESKLEKNFILLNGDSFLHLDLSAMQNEFSKFCDKSTSPSLSPVMMAVYNNLPPTPVPDNLKVQQGVVTDYQKNAGKQKGFTHVDAGVYVLPKELIQKASLGKFQLEDMWPSLMNQKQIKTFEVNEKFYDIGTSERLNEFERIVRDYF